MADVFQWVMGCQLLALFALRLAHEPGSRKSVDLKEGGWFRLVMSAVACAQVLLCIALVLIPQRFEFASLGIPESIRWLGAGFGILVLGGLSWTYRVLGDNYHSVLHIQNEQTLITEGPYRRVRHPMYTGLYLIFLAFSIQASNWLILVVGMGGLTALLLVRIPKEEALLLTHFGNTYRRYMQNTNRFLP